MTADYNIIVIVIGRGVRARNNMGFAPNHGESPKSVLLCVPYTL